MAKGFNQQQELGRFRMTFHPVTEVKSCYKSVNFEDGEQGLSQLACLSSLSLLKECDSVTDIFLIILGWSRKSYQLSFRVLTFLCFRKPTNQEAGAWLDGLTYTEKVKLLGS